MRFELQAKALEESGDRVWSSGVGNLREATSSCAGENPILATARREAVRGGVERFGEKRTRSSEEKRLKQRSGMEGSVEVEP